MLAIPCDDFFTLVHSAKIKYEPCGLRNDENCVLIYWACRLWLIKQKFIFNLNCVFL